MLKYFKKNYFHLIFQVKFGLNLFYYFYFFFILNIFLSETPGKNVVHTSTKSNQRASQ